MPSRREAANRQSTERHELHRSHRRRHEGRARFDGRSPERQGHPGRARDGRRLPRQPPQRHRSHQDQGDVSGRRQEALAPEGHRPRPRRLQVARPSGSAAASSSARSRATTPRRSTGRSSTSPSARRSATGSTPATSSSSTTSPSPKPKTKQFVAALVAASPRRAKTLVVSAPTFDENTLPRRPQRRSRRCSSPPPR